VENMSVEGLFVHGGDLWRLNTPLSCLQPPHQGKTLLYTVVLLELKINTSGIISLCRQLLS
ncbi:hypothetical protein R7G67_22605, partial [Klebsiella pneumoniae]|uniref:hypothetical protein n=1 Tax=Klebsiella pneumoniae TaxID=573 RepID=UPI0029651745